MRNVSAFPPRRGVRWLVRAPPTAPRASEPKWPPEPCRRSDASRDRTVESRRRLRRGGNHDAPRPRLPRPGTPRAPSDPATGAATAGEGDPPRLHHAAALRELEREVGVLLDEQDGDTSRATDCTTSKIFSTISGAGPWDGSSSSSRRGRDSRRAADRHHLLLAARQRAGDLGQAFLTRGSMGDALEVGLDGGVVLARYAPMRRFSSTVRRVKMPRPREPARCPRADGDVRAGR